MLTGLVAAMLALLVWPRPGSGRAQGRAARPRLDAAARTAAGWLIARLGGGPAPSDPVGLCAGLITELRAGASPEAAILAITEGGDLIPRARAAAELGEPVAEALAADAEAAHRRNMSVLAAMAACWRVSSGSGAGLADGLDRVARLAASAGRVRQDLDAETAAPRATARLLAGLPLIGLMFGELLGAAPVRWLTTTPPGLACLVLGAGFMLVGWLWSSRIVAAAEPRLSGGG